MYFNTIKMDIGEKIKMLRELRGFKNTRDLAKICKNTSPELIYKLEKGERQNVSVEKLLDIANALNVSVNELIYDSDLDISSIKAKHDPIEIPVLGKAACGHWLDITDLEYPVGHADKTAPAPTKDPNAFYVIAHGHSMVAADIQDGDYILIEPNSEVKRGDIVLAKNDSKGVTVKRYYPQENGTVILQPYNPDFEPIIVKPDEKFRIYRVAGIYKRF